MNISARKLIEEHGWEEGTALAHSKSNGVCEYCGDDLLHSWKSYSTMQIDHLLPKSLHVDHHYNFANYVTACATCNHMKRNFNPLLDGEDAASMLDDSRDMLIARVVEHLSNKYDDREREFEAIKGIIQHS